MHHILVVSSESLARAQIGLALRRWGYRVTEAPDVHSGVEQINGDSISLIVSSDAVEDTAISTDIPLLHIKSISLCSLREQVEKAFSESMFQPRMIENV